MQNENEKIDEIGTCESCGQSNVYLNLFEGFRLCNYCYHREILPHGYIYSISKQKAIKLLDEAISK